MEAKAHPAETLSTMRPSAVESVTKIRAALDEVKGHMGVPAGVDWTGGAYQLANRLAFLYCMNVRIGLPTWLALVNFVHVASHKATKLAEWRTHYETLFSHLALAPSAPLLDRVITVFPSAQ